MSRQIALAPGHVYHIFNRGNDRGQIFFEPRNYDHFLALYTRYVAPWVDTCAYALIPNHFHLMIRVPISTGIPISTCSGETSVNWAVTSGPSSSLTRATA